MRNRFVNFEKNIQVFLPELLVDEIIQFNGVIENNRVSNNSFNFSKLRVNRDQNYFNKKVITDMLVYKKDLSLRII